MKAVAVFLSVLIAAQGFAQTAAPMTDSRARELLDMSRRDAKKVIASMSNEELLQVRAELKQLLIGLQADFAVAESADGDRVGYKIRRWGGIGAGTLAVLTAAGFVTRAATFKGPSVDNDAVVILMLGFVATGAAVAVTAAGQVVVWLTPSEAKAVQSKIDGLVALTNLIDKKLR